jgi:hypothetical protein
MSTNTYVAYYVVPLHQSGESKLYASQAIAQQEKRVQDFMKSQPQGSVIKTFIETGDHFRTRHKWPELEAAVDYCLSNHANLVVAEINQLTHNEYFSGHIMKLVQASKDVFCCDQPFINKDNFQGISEHAKQQKMIHGQLIRAGLSRTFAKSGNPHALDVITKVNKPKIDNAIIFAVLLQPVIAEYQSKGYSQRKMVEALNEEGFTAPEGGKWVLSQLQKVLDRIKLNQSAFELENQFKQHRSQGLSPSESAEKLNENKLPCPMGAQWTQEAVLKVQERISRLHDIVKFYSLVIAIAPIIQQYRVDELTDPVFKNVLQQSGIHWGGTSH